MFETCSIGVEISHGVHNSLPSLYTEGTPYSYKEKYIKNEMRL